MRAGLIAVATALSVALVAPAGAETINVTIDKVAYAPMNISARVGDTIEWNNVDLVAHTSTARDKSFDIMIFPNKKQSLTLKKAGEFNYYCKFHPNMTGHISVKP
ncbi:MAG TPA: cupredoxin domain-containing protein [Pseudolabrys sp.]|jgi:plastocyanin|nr:cupredoxin domain-containing protein [Pseudolabrys sp.]